MGRNFMDSICENCPGNEGEDFSFKVLIGAPIICPQCGRRIELAPNLEGKILTKEGLNQRIQRKLLERR